MSYYEAKGRAEEFFFSKYEYNMLCTGTTLELFLEWFKNHNSDGIDLGENSDPTSKDNLSCAFAEIVIS